MSKVVSAAEAKNKFAEVIGRAAYGRERIIVERNGKPFAAVISIEDLKRLEELEDEIDSRLLRDAVEVSKGTTPVAEVIATYERFHQVKRRVKKA